jgi:hypothetical protein
MPYNESQFNPEALKKEITIQQIIEKQVVDNFKPGWREGTKIPFLNTDTAELILNNAEAFKQAVLDKIEVEFGDIMPEVKLVNEQTGLKRGFMLVIKRASNGARWRFKS